LRFGFIVFFSFVCTFPVCTVPFYQLPIQFRFPASVSFFTLHVSFLFFFHLPPSSLVPTYPTSDFFLYFPVPPLSLSFFVPDPYHLYIPPLISHSHIKPFLSHHVKLSRSWTFRTPFVFRFCIFYILFYVFTTPVSEISDYPSFWGVARS